jgi:hypothetical protein
MSCKKEDDMKTIITMIVSLCFLALVSGCSGLTPRQQKVLTGGAIGAGGGAAVGALSGGSAGVGALIGGAAGAVGGAIVP